MSDTVNWLKEATAAYNTPTWKGGRSGNHRSKKDIITDILTAVCRSKALNQAPSVEDVVKYEQDMPRVPTRGSISDGADVVAEHCATFVPQKQIL